MPNLKSNNMKKSTLTISWIFYVIGVLILLFGVLFSNNKYLFVSISWILLTVPWLICIIDLIKSKENAMGLWILFIIFVSTIAIPIWLARYANKRSLDEV